MRRGHFETLRPVCPVCRAGNDTGFPLRIAHVGREEAGHITEGVLRCTNQNCLREFPLIDGIPLIVTNIRQYVADNILAIYARRDLGDLTESVLGDCCGSGSAFDVIRQHLSSYTWDHYGDLDPNEPPDEPRPGSMLRNLELGLEVAGVRHRSSSEPKREPQQAGLHSQTLSSRAGEDDWQTGQSAIPECAVSAGPIIDVGCSVGRGSFALAERTNQLILQGGFALCDAAFGLGSPSPWSSALSPSSRRAGL